MTISDLDIPFNHPLHLPTLSDQAINVSSTNDFAPNLCSRLLSYHCCYSHPSPYQAVNVSSINKPTNFCSCSTSLSMSSQTLIGSNTPQSHKPCSCYFYNFYHCLNIANSLKTMNQELLRLKDWVLPTIPNSQKKFVELPTMDISMIGATPFNMLVQQASHTKNMEIFSILIRNIKKTLTLKSTTNFANKLPTEYHDFLDIFSQADSDILPPYRPYDHKIPLMEEKTPPWVFLYSIF